MSYSHSSIKNISYVKDKYFGTLHFATLLDEKYPRWAEKSEEKVSLNFCNHWMHIKQDLQEHLGCTGLGAVFQDLQ